MRIDWSEYFKETVLFIAQAFKLNPREVWDWTLAEIHDSNYYFRTHPSAEQLLAAQVGFNPEEQNKINASPEDFFRIVSKNIKEVPSNG